MFRRFVLQMNRFFHFAVDEKQFGAQNKTHTKNANFKMKFTECLALSMQVIDRREKLMEKI